MGSRVELARCFVVRLEDRAARDELDLRFDSPAPDRVSGRPSAAPERESAESDRAPVASEREAVASEREAVESERGVAVESERAVAAPCRAALAPERAPELDPDLAVLGVAREGWRVGSEARRLPCARRSGGGTTARTGASQ